MKTFISQYSGLARSKASYALATSFVLFSMVGCGAASDNGQIVNIVETPTGPLNTLYCPDVGVGEENCVLFDPTNPYARSAVNDQTKWTLNDTATPTLKSKFFLWATALAKQPTGENQFYTAESLHKIASSEGSTVAQDQAKRAYRAVLDNFFGSITYASNGEDTFLLRNWVADRLVNPATASLSQLYDNQSLALQAIEDWGYSYNVETTTISKKIN